jgi:hypothetical protein
LEKIVASALSDNADSVCRSLDLKFRFSNVNSVGLERKTAPNAVLRPLPNKLTIENRNFFPKGGRERDQGKDREKHRHRGGEGNRTGMGSSPPPANSGIEEALTVIPLTIPGAEQRIWKSKIIRASEKVAMTNLSLDDHLKRLDNDMGSFANHLNSFASLLANTVSRS